MRVYATKREIRTRCENCGRHFVETITGANKSEGADRCPHCTPLRTLPEVHKKELFSDGVKNAVRDMFLNGPNGNQKNSSKKK